MKKLIYSLGIFSALFAITGCEKNDIRNSDYTLVSNQGYLKVAYYSAYRGNPQNHIKINDERVSNTLGGVTNPTPFPGGGLNTGGGSTADYLGVLAGNTKVDIVVPKRGTNIDSLPLASFTGAIEADKRYTLFFTDTAANTFPLLVQDTLSMPDSGYAKFIYINLTPDLPSADLYIGTSKVASAIPYKGISPSFVVPTNSASTTWAVRAAGGTTNLFTYASASTIANQRIFTIASRGYNSVTSTADYRNRKISFIYTR